MISIVGLGNAASAIAEKFSVPPNYNVYLMNDKIARSSKYKFKLKTYESPEDYEKNVPNVKKFFKDIDWSRQTPFSVFFSDTTSL